MQNNQLKCGDYSILFSMHTTDNGQHFSWFLKPCTCFEETPDWAAVTMNW